MHIKDYMLVNGIREEMAEALVPLFHIREYNQYDTILEMGENTGVISYIEDGIVRGYYIDEEGRDITKCFSRENEWCCIYNYFSDEKSAYFIETVTPCTLASIKTTDFQRILDTYPNIRKKYDALFREAFMKVEDKGNSFQSMLAKERYLSYAEKNPDIVARVKQEYIASYLGITPSSLSRIKRDI